MRPLDFYEVGLRLAATGAVEADYRTAIGRLYYGLHHEACCRYFRKSKGPPIRTNSRHRDLCYRFNDAGDPVASDVGRLLRQLLELREQADYEIGSPIRIGSMAPDQTLAQALVLAKELLEALDRFSPGAAPDGCRCSVVWSTR